MRKWLLIPVLTCMSIVCQGRGQDAGPTPGPPQRVSSGVMAGMLVEHMQPVYPQAAREAHASGTVVLHALIGKTGHIENVSVISGPEIFRAAALDAVSQWVYRPYLLMGVPTAVETVITVNFQFGGGGPRPAHAADGGAPDGGGGNVAGSLGAAPAPSEDAPVRVSSGTMAGRLIQQPQPVFPEEAKAARVNGSVVMHVIIGKTGHVENIAVISGPEMLRAAYVDAVRRWVYKPYEVDGVAVRVETTVTLNMEFGGQ